MSLDEWDAERDEYLTNLHDEYGPEWAEENWYEVFKRHYGQAAQEFASDRLISYYTKHPNVAEPALRQLAKAKALLQADTEAALVFADSAVEIMFKFVLIRPLLYGLVHTESAAELVLTLIPNSRGVEHLLSLIHI